MSYPWPRGGFKARWESSNWHPCDLLLVASDSLCNTGRLISVAVGVMQKFHRTCQLYCNACPGLLRTGTHAQSCSMQTATVMNSHRDQRPPHLRFEGKSEGRALWHCHSKVSVCIQRRNACPSRHARVAVEQSKAPSAGKTSVFAAT